MNLKSQRRMAAQLLKVGKRRILFDKSKIPDIKEAITKADIRGLINSKVIQLRIIKGSSKSRTRKAKEQKRKGRRSGKGSKKGKAGTRNPKKKTWMAKIRTQRKFIQELRKNKKVSQETFKQLYKLSKNNQFRSKRHIKLYLEENKLFK